MIEIMVAIMILGVTFIGLIQAFPYALRIIKASENKTKASYIAQEKIEELYQQGYESFTDGVIEIKQRLGATGTDRFNFQRETTVTYIDQDLQDSMVDMGMKKIAIIVYYIDSISKQEYAYTLTTIMANR